MPLASCSTQAMSQSDVGACTLVTKVLDTSKALYRSCPSHDFFTSFMDEGSQSCFRANTNVHLNNHFKLLEKPKYEESRRSATISFVVEADSSFTLTVTNCQLAKVSVTEGGERRHRLNTDSNSSLSKVATTFLDASGYKVHPCPPPSPRLQPCCITPRHGGQLTVGAGGAFLKAETDTRTLV